MQKICGDTIRKIIDRCLESAPCDVDARFNEPMSEHTTFKVGGPADCWLCPQGEGFPFFSASLLNRARAAGVPVFILGGGANIVVSDNGIRGIVLDTGGWKGGAETEEGLAVKSGTTMDEAAAFAACSGLSGLEFLAGMPGTIGGAVWMNARCYGKETADILAWTEIIRNEELEMSGGYVKPVIRKIVTGQMPDGVGFGYKRSPFQDRDCLILSACFRLRRGEENVIRSEMEKNRQDRQAKGHYRFPCAGSAFKNNRDFDRPTGQIIDELGLRGFQLGGAQIAPFHGNIIINTGGASAADIRALTNETAARVKAATGFVLEPEILFVGEW